MDQDFGSNDPFAGHDPCCGVAGGNPTLLIVAVGLVILGWLLSVLAQRSGREGRLTDIYETILKISRAAAEGPVDRAAERMIELRHVVRKRLGPLFMEGSISGTIKEIGEVLDKAPKAEASKTKPTYSAKLDITDNSLAAPGEDKGAKSTNEKAHEAAKKFYAYWSVRLERMADLRELLNNLAG